jgi:hypothetical protein
VVDAMQQQADETRETVIQVTESEYNRLMGSLEKLREELRLLQGGDRLPPIEPPAEREPG